MSISIDNLKPAKGATRKKKRIGRGNASGHGTYATRGLKGQKSRKGVSNLKRLGMKQVLLRTPKKRGFTSLYPKAHAVNLSDISAHFAENGAVSPKTLKAKGLVKDAAAPVKVLGQGELAVKGLAFSGCQVSGSAKEKIEKNGGKIL
jgi:large subunit ribosomal protein L15